MPIDRTRGFQFGAFTVEPLKGAVTGDDGQSRHLPPKAMDVLVRLAETAPEPVTREDLIDAVWGERFVSDEVLTHAIKELRHALGDSPTEPHYIQTIPKRGYQLLTEVSPSVDPAPAGRRRKRGYLLIVVSLLCASVILFAYDKWWMSQDTIASLAVLPLKNVSVATDQAHFAEGMTEALTTELGQISSLRVTSRTSAMRYKSTEKLLPEICRELDVDAIVEGSVQQAGDEVQITLQLIDGRKDRHLWAGNFRRDLGDIFTLQSEVAREIATAIHATLTPRDKARLAHERATRGDAIRLWILGNHHLKYRSDVDWIGKAEQALAEAIKLDPDFAHAHAALAQIYLVRVGWHIGAKLESFLPLAEEAAETALQLDPYLADAHFALGEFYLYAWDWEAADRAFGRGVELNPNHSHGSMLYVNFLLAMGRVEEAVELARKGVAVDPLWPAANAELGWALWISGRDQEAMRQYKRVLELAPDSTSTRLWMALVHIKAGRVDEALPLLEMRKEHIEDLAAEPLGLLGRSFAFIGHHDEAREILSRLQKRREIEYVPAIALAHVYVGLGDHDKSIEWLEKAYEERNISMTWLRENPAYNRLRDDPRFQELVARMNFPPRS